MTNFSGKIVEFGTHADRASPTVCRKQKNPQKKLGGFKDETCGEGGLATLIPGWGAKTRVQQ
jgi:hypothetical protein